MPLLSSNRADTTSPVNSTSSSHNGRGSKRRFGIFRNSASSSSQSTDPTETTNLKDGIVFQESSNISSSFRISIMEVSEVDKKQAEMKKEGLNLSTSTSETSGSTLSGRRTPTRSLASFLAEDKSGRPPRETKSPARKMFFHRPRSTGTSSTSPNPGTPTRGILKRPSKPSHGPPPSYVPTPRSATPADLAKSSPDSSLFPDARTFDIDKARNSLSLSDAISNDPSMPTRYLPNGPKVVADLAPVPVEDDSLAMILNSSLKNSPARRPPADGSLMRAHNVRFRDDTHQHYKPKAIRDVMGWIGRQSRSCNVDRLNKQSLRRTKGNGGPFSLYGEVEDLCYDLTFFCRCFGEEVNKKSLTSGDSPSRRSENGSAYEEKSCEASMDMSYETNMMSEDTSYTTSSYTNDTSTYLGYRY